MKRNIRPLFFIGLLAWGFVWALSQLALADDHTGSRVIVLQVDGVIGPASNDFIVRGIEASEQNNAQLIIIELNTPGGLDTSMRDIIRKILASEIPVITYVAPSGSRAASAGTYIAYASHIAAMAPATNIGSATPVNIAPGGFGGDQKPADDAATEEPDSTNGKEDKTTTPKLNTAMERKVVNDAVAYIKGLARLRDRNEQWAEDAVRSAVNLTAEDALAQNVIDIVAIDVNDLLAQIDGRTIKLQTEEITLNTQNAVIEIIAPNWRTKILTVITNPNVAYILMFVGMYGLFFELSNPGVILPGVLGGISILLALYAFQVLPVNYAGLALILLGITFMVSEMFVTSFGILGVGGVVAFVFGSLILMKTDVPDFQISRPLIIAITLLTGLFVFAVLRLAIRQRSVPVSGGREQMIGGQGVVITDFQEEGIIHIHGETWAACSTTPLVKDQLVRVLDMDGLVLKVEPIKEN